MKDDVINWVKVRKECKRLKLFEGGYFNISLTPFEQQCWNVFLSTRARGKTTSALLTAMVVHKIYNYRIEYARLQSDDITPKSHSSFFDKMIEKGLISRVTEGKYNSCIYKSGYWYYVRMEDGQIVEKSNEAFMHCFSIRKSFDLKSSYNSNGKIIIYDEFIDYTKPYNDYFVNLCDCMSTIFRDSIGWVWLLANTIDPQSIWFKELGVSREVAKMKQGETLRIDKENMTPVFVQILPADLSEKKKKHNLALFSFNNSKLDSITGAGNGWQMRIYPRLQKGGREYIFQNIYINADGFFVRLDIVNSEKVGYCLVVTDTEVGTLYEFKEDAIILTTQDITSKNELYKLNNNNKLIKLIVKLMRANKIYYTSNEAGVTFDSFINKCV